MSDIGATTIIHADGFHKAYEGFHAVRDVSFQVQSGQILGVIGPNGAGKTTTMRTLAALIPPTSGRMTVAGHDVQQQPVEVKRSLAYVPDDPPAFPHLTVEEHLAFTAAAFGVPDCDVKATELLETFELTAKRKVPAKQLSRGMRQKLAICCAYLYDPVAILFDEPLTGLDPMGIRMLKKSILQRAASGAAVMISSHLLAMVEDICTHILLLDQGRQTFFGSVADLRQQFQEQDRNASLEEIFFMATEHDDAESTTANEPHVTTA